MLFRSELDIGPGDRPDLTWDFVPLDDATMSLDLQAEGLRWTGSGEVGCPERVAAWPIVLDARGGRRLTGTFGWSRPGASGVCAVDLRP